MQIGGDATTARKCHGDSGGPTFLDIQTTLTNKRRVVGITSHAYDSSDCVKGGIDTRVDAYLDWLDETLQERCDDGTRVWCDVKGLIPPAFYEPTESSDAAQQGSAGDVVRSGGCATGGVSALALLPALALARLRRRKAR